MEYFSYYVIEKIYFPKKKQWFWSRFFYIDSLFQRHFQSCLSHRPSSQNEWLCYLIGNRVFNSFEWCFTLIKTQKEGQSCTILSIDWLKVMCKRSGKRITEEIPNMKYHRDICQDNTHSLMMYECILVANFVRSLDIRAPLFMHPLINRQL